MMPTDPTPEEFSSLVDALEALSPDAINDLASVGITVVIQGKEMGSGAHAVEFGRQGWGLSHPPGCRREGSLLNCPYNKAIRDYVEAEGGVAPLKIGRYQVELVDGDLEFEFVE